MPKQVTPESKRRDTRDHASAAAIAAREVAAMLDGRKPMDAAALVAHAKTLERAGCYVRRAVPTIAP